MWHNKSLEENVPPGSPANMHWITFTSTELRDCRSQLVPHL